MLVRRVRGAQGGAARVYTPIDLRRGRLAPVAGDNQPLIKRQLCSGRMARQMVAGARLGVNRADEALHHADCKREGSERADLPH